MDVNFSNVHEFRFPIYVFVNINNDMMLLRMITDKLI